MELKYCSACQQSKPIIEFGICHQSKDGHLSENLSKPKVLNELVFYHIPLGTALSAGQRVIVMADMPYRKVRIGDSS